MYTTVSGDTWDKIAKAVYGSESRCDWLMQSNYAQLGISVFASGTVLNTPELQAEQSGTLPPWR